MNFDKYKLYTESVQSPEVDAEFFDTYYKAYNGEEALVLKEDFCGTFLNSIEWVKRGATKQAICVDLDPEPIEYSQKNYLPSLEPSQSERLQIFKRDVLEKSNETADVIAALNFSTFIFKERKKLKKYLKRSLKTLKPKGLFFMDCFGGMATQEPLEEETEHKNFSYYWDQDSFDPVNNQGQFYIHFKPKGEKKIKKVFSYNWRMWTLPELRDLLIEVGFHDVHILWEGTGPNGEGNGKFTRAEKGEVCESWVAYVIGQKK